jgi:hypothetical protein
MTVSEIFNAVRNLYITELAKAIYNQDVHIEPAYRLVDGNLAVEGDLLLPCRADLIYKSGKNMNESSMVDSGSKLDLDEFIFNIESTQLAISAFTWDWLTVKVSGISEEVASVVFTKWFMNWFDAEDTNQLNADGLYEVVHFMSDLKTENNDFYVNLDLGSSPAEALEDLLFRLSDEHAMKVSLS